MKALFQLLPGVTEKAMETSVTTADDGQDLNLTFNQNYNFKKTQYLLLQCTHKQF
jgi:hypothetical protein